MKKLRSIHPGVEALEQKALLSAAVAPHLEAKVHAAPIVAETASANVILIGAVVNGYGGVSPLGGVRGFLRTRQRALILANPQGNLTLRLLHVHRYPDVTNFFNWRIVRGTGQFASFSGQGHSTVNVDSVFGHVVTWSASFYA
jgi:hypothetical protein